MLQRCIGEGLNSDTAWPRHHRRELQIWKATSSHWWWLTEVVSSYETGWAKVTSRVEGLCSHGFAWVSADAGFKWCSQLSEAVLLGVYSLWLSSFIFQKTSLVKQPWPHAQPMKSCSFVGGNQQGMKDSTISSLIPLHSQMRSCP